MAKEMRDLLDVKDSQRTPRGKAIAAARKKTGDNTDWKKVFDKLDKSKKGKRE